MAEDAKIGPLTQNRESRIFEPVDKENSSAQDSLQQRNVTSSLGESVQNEKLVSETKLWYIANTFKNKPNGFRGSNLAHIEKKSRRLQQCYWFFQ